MASAPIPRSADELVTLIEEAWRPFRMAVIILGHRALAAVGPHGWSLGAHLAHVAAWEALTIRQLATYRESDAQLPGPDTDRFNAEVAAANASRDAEALRSELDSTHLAFREAVLELDPTQLAANEAWAVQMVAGNSYEHYSEHQAILGAARPATVVAMRAALATEWREFRAAIRDRGRTGLAATVGLDQTSDGRSDGTSAWTYKDLVAHLAGWMELVPRRLAEIRDGTYTNVAGPAGIDATNARAVAERRLVGPEAILDELDTAYQLVTEALDRLSDADLADRRVFNVLAFTTYLHFEAHHADLGIGTSA